MTAAACLSAGRPDDINTNDKPTRSGATSSILGPASAYGCPDGSLPSRHQAPVAIALSRRIQQGWNNAPAPVHWRRVAPVGRCSHARRRPSQLTARPPTTVQPTTERLKRKRSTSSSGLLFGSNSVGADAISRWEYGVRSGGRRDSRLGDAASAASCVRGRRHRACRDPRRGRRFPCSHSVDHQPCWGT